MNYSVAKSMMRHLLGYCNNLNSGFEEQVVDVERSYEE